MPENTLHILITTRPLPKIWLKKFGTNEKPHYLKKCKLCGNTYGEHYSIGCVCPTIKRGKDARE